MKKAILAVIILLILCLPVGFGALGAPDERISASSSSLPQTEPFADPETKSMEIDVESAFADRQPKESSQDEEISENGTSVPLESGENIAKLPESSELPETLEISEIPELICGEHVYKISDYPQEQAPFATIDGFSEEELLLLHAFLLEVESEQLNINPYWFTQNRRMAPDFLGTVGDYKLCESNYGSYAVDTPVLPQGCKLVCHTYPAAASKVGMYLIGNGEVFRLEDALGVLVEFDDIEHLLKERRQPQLAFLAEQLA